MAQERLNPMNLTGVNNAFRLGPGGVPYGKELTESWESLQKRIQAGDFSGINIGDYKTITLTTKETVIAEVAGIDQYYNCCDTPIEHHIDFISRDSLKEAKRWNTTDTNNGNATKKNPWLASALYTELNTNVFATLPADLQSVIIEKRAIIEERYGTGNLTTDSLWSLQDIGKLWLPTEVEVLGTACWSQMGFGTGGCGCNWQYPIFIGGSKHLIKGDGNGGNRYRWWHLSVVSGSGTDVCSLDSNGYACACSAIHTDVRAPLCFRVG